jgi:nitrogen fixation/metabolism regulation signal transduction histidine kinase
MSVNAREAAKESKGTRSLRSRILAFVGALVILSVLGSTISLVRITEVNQILDVTNRVSVPLGRLFVQIQVDADLYHREFERSLGATHWKDPHWRARSVPKWVTDVLESEITRAVGLINAHSATSGGAALSRESRDRWKQWVANVTDELTQLKAESQRLENALAQKDEPAATREYAQWTQQMDEWKRQLQWGANEYDRAFRQNFSLAESRVIELRTGLELILLAVVSLSLLLLWLGERALRPLHELTRLAREITRRGLKKGDKNLFPEIPLQRNDEVSALAREFHNMATALLEREKMVDAQKHRLLEQNSLLRSLGELNENVLNSIEGVLLVTDLEGRITQCNPVTERWLHAPAEMIRGKHYAEWGKIRAILELYPEADAWLETLKFNAGSGRCSLRPSQMIQAGEASDALKALEGKIYGGHLMPLKSEEERAGGAIWVLDDLTEEMDLQERLRRAENMAAVGRMSAQVAHEVRNPLHSIGLEAEMAAEMASKLGNISLKQSLQSILGSVDRLEKITDNYLKLSKLSTGEKKRVNLGEIVETVLATYAPVCEAQRVEVDWKREARADLHIQGDADLLEQALGNLFKNSLQALESVADQKRIEILMGNTEGGRVWLRIQDNGPGIPAEVRAKLFVPFVTTKAQGTGLGLSFVKRVVEEHAGSLECLETQSGACFEIALPSTYASIQSNVEAQSKLSSAQEVDLPC